MIGKKKVSTELLDNLIFAIDVAETVELCTQIIWTAEKLKDLSYFTDEQSSEIKQKAQEKIYYIMEGK